MIKAYKLLLVVFCMLLLVLPGIQKAFKILPVDKFKLVKVPDAMDLPSPSFKNFIQNTYQDTVNAWFNYTTGFKPLLVRMRNQIDYSCFHLAHGKIVRGKGDCLFLDENFTAYLGWQVDSGLLRRKVDTIAMLKQHLSSLGIPLLYVVAPGKGDYYADAFPDGYLSMKKDITYYDLIQQQLKAHYIEYINLHEYFDRPGAVYLHPIFSKQGLHWSVFGAALALDTTYKKIASVLKFEPVNVDLSHDTVSSKPRFPEDDLAEMVNMFSIPHVDTLGYPNPVCTSAHPAAVKKPKVLFIGDSFTFIFGLTNLPTQLFDPASKYWFYMRTEKDFADIMKDGADLTKKADLDAALKQFDMVIILSTDGRYHYGDYGLYSRLLSQQGAITSANRAH